MTRRALPILSALVALAAALAAASASSARPIQAARPAGVAHAAAQPRRARKSLRQAHRTAPHPRKTVRHAIRRPKLHATLRKGKRHPGRHPHPAAIPSAPAQTPAPAPAPPAPVPSATADAPPAPAPAPVPTPSPAPAPPVTPPSGSSSSAGVVVGLVSGSDGWGGASTGPRLDQVTSQTGAKWLREEFDWTKVEAQPGVFDFSYYDHFMLLAAQRGVHILALLYATPSWAGPAVSAIPSDPSAFGQFVAAMVSRYGTNGSFWSQYPSLRAYAIRTWEIWNEPYASNGNNGDYDPGAYARLVKAAAIAGRASDPNAKFLLASEMQSALTNGAWQWWTDAMYQAVPDLNNYFDGVAMHDYGNDTTTLNPIVPGRPYDNYGHIWRIEDLRQQFVNHGAANKPFWITEIGWSTCNDSAGCVTPAQQAANLTTFFDDVHGPWSSFVQGVFVYRYNDLSDPTSAQGGYGLTYQDGTAKPALTIFQQQVAGSA